MKKKGFTLIELLAVIVIIAVVAVVSVPIVLDVIDDTKTAANKTTAYGIMDAAKLYYTESVFDPSKQATLGSGDIYNLISVSGGKPENGKLYITEEGKISMSLVMDNKCYVKTFESDLEIHKLGESKCEAYVGEDDIIPVVDFEISGTKGDNDWFVSDVYMKIVANDIDDEDGNQSGINYINWCVGSDCNPVNRVNSTLIFQDNNSIIICAQATDNFGNKSEKKCTSTLNIDKTAPQAGTILVNGEEFEDIWYGEDLILTPVDGTDSEASVESGHSETIINDNVTNITSNTSGTKVIVTTTDKAGNSSTREYTIKIDKTLPIVTIRKSDNSTMLTATVTNSTAILSGFKYQWYKDDIAIENAITSTYTATESGVYKVVITTNSGQIVTSDEVEIKGYTVSYNTNGSLDTVESQIKIEDITLKLTDTIPVRTGYTFLGWGITSDDKTVDYAKSSDYIKNESIELYAIWKKTLTATFESNGATLSFTSSKCDIYNAETECEIKTPTITRDGYIVVGFGLNTADTEAVLLSGAKVNITDNITYIALTKEVKLSLTETSGTTYVGGNNLTTKVDENVSMNYGSLSCVSSNTSIATCSVNGNEITMTPGNTSGSAVITVTEDNVGKEAKYTFNNLETSFDIDVTFKPIDAKYYEEDNIKYWLNGNYFVRVNVESSTSISKIEMCTATTNTCDPTGKSSVNGTSGSMEIVQESNNNRVCVIAYEKLTNDQYRASAPICSEAFGIDKTKPTAGTILVNGETPSTNWYNETLEITKVDGTDELSEHLETTVDVTSITSNTASKVVTVTTKDKAGNESTRTYTLKTDITTPSVNVTKASNSTLLTASVTNSADIISGVNYQWYKNNAAITGATQSTYTATEAGTYKVVVTTGSGKTSTSTTTTTINSYTITYNMNGGTATIAEQIKVEDIALTLSTITPSRTGYTFKGWSTSSTATTATYASGGSYTENASNTLYAVWQVNSYQCNAGYYLDVNSTSCTKCEAGSYCAGGTYNYSSNVQGKETCPTFYASSASGSDNINDCYMTTTSGNYIATSKATSETTCPKGSYCLGGSTVKYGATGGSTTCPTGYGNSVAGSNEESDCYLTTTAGSYIVTAKSATQTQCPANYYCESTNIYYGSIGGSIACPTEYNTSIAGSDNISDCYKTLTATFNANGATLTGTTNPSCKVYNGETSCSVTAPTITRAGYIIVGFNESASETTSQVNSGASLTLSSNKTYYAITKEVTMNIDKSNITTYVGGSSVTATVSGTNLGSLNCTTSNDKVANCSISGTTVTVTPGGTAGSAVITVTEGNVSKNVKITVNNKTTSFDITATFTADDAKYYKDDSIKYWLNSNYYVKVNVTSSETISKIEMCTATTNTCDPTGKSSVNGTSGSMEIVQESNNNRVCVQAIDNLGRTSSVSCSEAFGLDKTKPTAGTILVNGSAPSTGWYNKKLTITKVDGSDGSSGHLSTSVDVTSITSNTTTSGKVVTVTTTDKAGNSSTRTYTLKVDITTPTVSITKASGSTKLTANVTNADKIVSGYTFVWYKDGTALASPTTNTFEPTTGGKYKVDVVSKSSLRGTSNEITIGSYTVKYDMNGGTGTIANQTKVEDIALTLSTTTPSRTGYTFKGWSTSSTATSATYATGGSYTANSGATLYAVWQVNSYTCAAGQYLNASSTSCTTCPAGSYCAGGTYNYSSSVQGKTACPTGYTNSDAGSNEESDCYLITTPGSYIATAKSATQSTCTANYYCAATKINYGSTGGRTACPTGYGTSASGSDTQSDCYKTLTATFNGNGATVSASTASCKSYYNNSTCEITAPTITRTSDKTENFTIYGYATSASGRQADVVAKGGDKITLSSNTTYYAISAYAVRIAYNANGGSGTMDNSTCTIWNSANTCSITTKANGFTRTGYTFKGWGTGTSSVTHNASTSYNFEDNDTLYAVWQINSYACAAGTYLNSNSTSCTTCPVGSYCPGGTYNYSSSVQGKTICPTGYTSDAGTSAQNRCYVTTDEGKYISSSTTATSSTCTNGYYCPGGVKVNYGSTGGRTGCPSGYGSSASGSDAQTDCYKTYTLSYNANSGSGTPSSQTCNVYYNNSSCDITISLSTTPTRTGYTYKGWSTSSTATSATYANSSKITLTENTTIYAVWEAKSYTCSAGQYLKASSTSCTRCEAGSYCPGGTYNYSTSIQGKSECPTGYTSESGTSSQDRCYITTSAGKYIASANSSTQTTCTSGSYCPGSVTVYYGSTGGRTTCPSGSYCSSGVISPTTCPASHSSSTAGAGSINSCYNSYTLTFNANGGSGAPSSKSCKSYYNNSDCKITISSTAPTRDNYTFLGWSKGSAATTSSYSSGGSITISSNTTLYAVWQASYSCATGTLTNDSSLGYICVASNPSVEDYSCRYYDVVQNCETCEGETRVVDVSYECTSWCDVDKDGIVEQEDIDQCYLAGGCYLDRPEDSVDGCGIDWRNIGMGCGRATMYCPEGTKIYDYDLAKWTCVITERYECNCTPSWSYSHEYTSSSDETMVDDYDNGYDIDCYANYACPSGWSTYSGSGSGMECYKSASTGN